MAEPKTQYEYGRTPEETATGLPGFFGLLRGQLADAFTPERREIITPSKTTYIEADGMYYPNTTPGVYGPVERGIKNMPVVQGAKSAYEFLGELISSGEKRGETADALVKGIGTLLEDQKRAGINAGLGGGLQFYDPEQKRVVAYDPFLIPATMGLSGALAPVRGPGAVLGMFAGRNAATADPKKFARAEEMASKGRSRKDIWEETGLFRWERNGEPISDWRYEISDEMSKAVFNPRVQTPTGRLREKENPVLSDLFQHSEFYKAFPGKTDKVDAPSLASLEKDRAAVRAKLLELKASNKNPELPEYAAEYQKLQQEDADLLKAYILNAPTSDAPGLPPSVKSEPPFIGTRGMEARMERPVADIPLRTMRSEDWGGAYYTPYLDTIGTKTRPGAPGKYGNVPWDEQGKYVQPFSSAQYDKAMGKAVEDFKEAGMSLDTSTSGGKTEYRLRKWGGGPEDTINPEDLPDYGYNSLKRQWDRLQAFGNIYYKKDYDPALRFRGDMIHEGQHGIQYRTPGFEGGANPKEFTTANIGRVDDPQTGKRLTPKEIYMRILGEAEARLADTRKDLTDKQRSERFPWTREGGLDRREDDLLLRKDLGVDYKASSSSNNPPVSKAPENRELRGKLFQELANKQRGTPEILMVEAQGILGGGVLSQAIEHTGDLTHRIADKYDFFDGYGYDVGNKVDRVLRSLRSEYGFEKEFNENIRAASSYKGIPEKRLRDAATKALQKYADAHKSLRVYNEPQKWARDAAVALGEQRFTDAREHLSKLQNLLRGEGDAYRRAAGEFNPNFEDLGVARKASGGFVDKPLYTDARIGRMI